MIYALIYLAALAVYAAWAVALSIRHERRARLGSDDDLRARLAEQIRLEAQLEIAYQGWVARHRMHSDRIDGELRRYLDRRAVEALIATTKGKGSDD